MAGYAESSGGSPSPIELWGSSANIAPYGVSPDGTNPGVDLYGGGGGADSLCVCSTGDPINLGTGDYFETATDLKVPAAGVPLTFTRTYDAQAAQAEVHAGSAPGPLGYGWSDSLGMNVTDSGTKATVTQPNGSQLVFNWYAQGTAEPVGSSGITWCPDDSTNGVWCPSSPRILATLTGATDGSGGPWQVTDQRDRVHWAFDASGNLTSITNYAGDALAASSYSPGSGQQSCPTGDTCTAWTSQTQSGLVVGTLVEAFDSVGHLVDVFDANASSGSQTTSFTYSGSGCSIWGGGANDLCSATDPGSRTTTYTYDASQSSPDQYDLTTVDPPAGGQVTNTYDASGRLSKQVIATGGTNSEQDFAYASNSSVSNGTQTAVTSYPDGSGGSSTTTTYVFSNGVEVEKTDGTGAKTFSAVDPVTLLPQGTVDGNGNATATQFQHLTDPTNTSAAANPVLVTDADGNTTQSAYTSDNLPWCQVDAADYSNGVTCPATEPTSPPSPGSHIGYTLDIYDGNNNLISTTDPMGNTTVNAYTSGVAGVPDNLQYCTVDATQYAAGVRCPAYGAAHVVGTTMKTFDATGDVLTSTDPDGNTTTTIYGSAANPGLPTVTTDPDGKVTTDTYDAAGDVLTETVTDTGGTYSATTQYDYGAAGHKWCEVSPYEYSQGVRCPANAPSSPPTGTIGYTDTIYDSVGQVTSTTNPIGGTTLYAYDASGNKYCTVTPRDYANGTRCPSLPLTAPTQTSDSYLGATIDVFDADNRVAEEANPLGGITLNTYDGAGNLLTKTVESNDSTNDPNQVTTNTYDPNGNVISSEVGTGSSARTTDTSYDPNGDAFCTASPNAVAAGSSAYQCPTWQPGWISQPPNPSSLYSSTPTSAQANNVTTTFFNADGTQVQSTNPDVQTTVTAVDPDQRTYCSADATNVATWLANPANSTVYPYLCPSSAPSSAPTGTTGYTATVFDANGNTLSTTDQVGDTTSYTYDPDGNKLTTTNPDGQVTTDCYYGQNGAGQCAAGAPTGGGSSSDLYSETTPATSADPSGAVTTHTYFPGDLAHTTTTPAGTTTDSYDANLDKTGVSYSGTASGYTAATNQSFTYFPDGTRHTMTDASGTTTYAEDAAGDVTGQALVAGPGTGLSNQTTGYSYFDTGTLSGITYPSYGSTSNPQATYTYNAEGDMASVSDWQGDLVSFGHDANGNLTSQDNAVSALNLNGTSSTTYAYDAANQNTSATSTMNQTCSGSTETLTQSFAGTGGSRNPDNQVTQDSESYTGSCSSQPGYQRNYSYDQAGRVTYEGATVQGSSPTNLGYDAAGNPTTMSNMGTSATNTFTQSFDNAGEVTGQTPKAGSGGSATTYTYDTLGDRTSATTGSSTTSLSYNQAGQLTSSTAANENLTYNGDGLVAAAGTTPIWSAPNNIDSNGTYTRSIYYVSCPTTAFCMAVDRGGRAVSEVNGVWGTPVTISSDTLQSVSCPTTAFCMAVGNNGAAYVYDGTSWSSALTNTTNTLYSVSCPSATLCVVVGASGSAYIYSGSSFVAASSPGSRTINSVSCPSATFCMAVGKDETGMIYNGSTWSTANLGTTTNSVISVSCTSSSYCQAIDSSNQTYVYSSGSWSLTNYNIDPSGAITSLSCTSTTFCKAVDSGGNVLTYTNSSWGSPVNIDSTNQLNSISCISSSSCTAVDNIGNELTFQAGESQFTWESATSSLPIVLSDSTNDYIYGPTGEPVEQINITATPPTDNPEFLTYTPSDSSWLVTNTAGDEVGFYRYDAYGTLAFGVPQSPFGYAGQYQDGLVSAQGLYDMRARWYDAGTGEFMTIDPALASTNQAYAYSSGDPVNRSDPAGKSPTAPSSCGSTSACVPVPPKFRPNCYFPNCAWDNYVNASAAICSTPGSSLVTSGYYFSIESEGAGAGNLPLLPRSLYKAAYFGDKAAQGLIYMRAVSEANLEQAVIREGERLASINAQLQADELAIQKTDRILAHLDQETSLSGIVDRLASYAQYVSDGASCIAVGSAVGTAGGLAGSSVEPGGGTVVGGVGGFASGCAVGVGWSESGQDPSHG